MSESERPRLSAKKSTGVKVEVFDEEFELKPITRSVQKVLSDIEVRFRDLEDPDEIIAAIGDGLEALLETKSDGEGVVSVKTLLSERWLADELALQDVSAFFYDLQAAGSRPS